MTLNENGEEEVTAATMITNWSAEIQKAARKAANDWPGVVEEEDLAQEVYLHILESPGTQSDLAEMDDTSRYRTLHKIAQRIASQERTDYEHFTGSFMYSVDEVRGLLEAVEDSGVRMIGSSWSVGDYTRSGSSDHSDPTASAALLHLSVSEAQKRLGEALDGLKAANARQYDALIKRFGEGEVPHREDHAEFKVIERALASLTTRMNRGHKRSHVARPDGPGTRKAVPVSTARYLSKEGWDADYMPAPAHLRDNHIEPEVWQ